MTDYKMSKMGKAFLVCREGICLTPYLDSVGVKTIGIGATKSEISDLENWGWDKEITLEQAFNMMGESLHKYEAPLNKALTKEIPQHMFDALVSWCYNVGTGWVPKASVIKAINRGASSTVVYNSLMMYKRPPEIIGRRTKEAVLLTTGDYGDLTKADLFKTNSRHHPIYGGKIINPLDHIGGGEQPNQPKEAEAPVNNKVSKKWWQILLDVLAGIHRR